MPKTLFDSYTHSGTRPKVGDRAEALTRIGRYTGLGTIIKVNRATIDVHLDNGAKVRFTAYTLAPADTDAPIAPSAQTLALKTFTCGEVVRFATPGRHPGLYVVTQIGAHINVTKLGGSKTYVRAQANLLTKVPLSELAAAL